MERKTTLPWFLFTGFVLILYATPGLTDTAESDSLYQAKKHFSFAVQHKNNDNLELAREQYKLSIAYVDTMYQVHFSYADLLMRMGLSLEARREYLATLILNPVHFKSASILAKLYYDSADYDSALVMYETMRRLEPDNNDILAGTAGLLDYLERDDEALKAYDTLVERGAASFDNLMRAADLALSVEKFDRACRYASLALEQRNDDVDALRKAVAGSMGINDLDGASRHLRHLVEMEPSELPLLIRLEDLYRLRGDRMNLLWALERHHGIDHEDTGVIGELAELLLHANEDDRALGYLRTGLALAPADGRLRILMGEYYRNRGEDDRALEEFTKALEDEKWRASAQEFIWQINPPESDEKKAEREFFSSGKARKNGQTPPE